MTRGDHGLTLATDASMGKALRRNLRRWTVTITPTAAVDDGRDEFRENLMTLGGFNIDRVNDTPYQEFVATASVHPRSSRRRRGRNFDFGERADPNKSHCACAQMTRRYRSSHT